MKTRLFLILALCCYAGQNYAQGYNGEQVHLSMFVERMYKNAPFEGCRIVEDYDNSYLLSVVLLDTGKYASPVAMNRVAQVKAQRMAGEFFNGTQSYSEFVVKTPRSEDKNGEEVLSSTYELIKTNSVGYVNELQLLTSFNKEGAFKVFVFYHNIYTAPDRRHKRK